MIELRKAVALATIAATFAVCAPASAAECNGDECQGPPPAPAEIVPGTAVVEGPPNPPVHYPKVAKHHHKKKKHKPRSQRGAG